MCGIVGVWSLGGERVDPDALLRARDCMTTRGPDDAGIWIEDAIGLAHRRLSVVDLSSNGHQPMSSPDGRLHLVYNGEIYNFRELRAELEGLGYTFKSETDTEVLLHGLDAWGCRLFSKLLGMFALGAWNSETRRLTLARGPLGKKPLFVCHRPGKLLAFASTLAPLLELPGVAREFNPGAVHEYLRYGYVPAPNSILQDVQKVLPGECRTYSESGRVETNRFFDLDAVANEQPRLDGSDEEILDSLHDVLLDATQRRMVADVPLGAFLSGGVDSSLVTALMSKSAAEVQTFTVAFEESRLDESAQAAEIASILGVRNTVLRMSSAEMLGFIDRITEYCDEPIADESLFPTLAVSQLAREHVTVALTGDGGDEPFCGYGGYRTIRYAETYYSILPGVIRRTLASAHRLLPQRVADVVRQTSAPNNFAFAAQYARLDKTVDTNWLTAGRVDSPDAEVERRLRSLDSMPVSERYQVHNATHRMIDAIETKVDRATMAFSLEARCPLLDHRVVSFGLQLPARMRIRNGQTKWALRTLLRRYLPARLVDRPKQGFEPPMRNWLRGPLKEMANDCLSASSLARIGLIDKPALDQIVSRHMDGRENHARLIWGLIMLELWSRRYLR